MQCDVYLSAVNYPDIAGMLDAFAATPWEYPDSVQLLVEDQQDSAIAVHTPARPPG